MVTEISLVDLLRVYNNGEELQLKPGDLAEYKPGMRATKSPEYGEHCVVAEVLEASREIFEQMPSGSSYYRSPVTLKFGVKDEDGDLVFYHGDLKRFRPFNHVTGG
jgi:hypothetical protein